MCVRFVFVLIIYSYRTFSNYEGRSATDADVEPQNSAEVSAEAINTAYHELEFGYVGY